MNSLFKPGLYVITPQRYPDQGQLLSDLRLALEGGASMVQFRDKSGDDHWRLDVARAVARLCDEFDAPLIINDDVELASRTGAAGVHLGKDDGSIERARHLLGPGAIIGASCYNQLSLARKAAREGADYLAFGSVYQSGSKPGAVHCPLDTVNAAAALGLPVVAIGGITPDNGRAVVEAGADSLAVIRAVFDAPDIQAAATSFSEFWKH